MHMRARGAPAGREATIRAATTQELAAAATSSAEDAIGRSCADAVAGLRGEVGLLLAFASGELDYGVGAEALERAAAGAPAAGMTGKGLMSADGPVDDGCVAIAFGADVNAAVGRRVEASSNLRIAGRDATKEALEGLGTGADMVFLFIDSTRGDIADTVSGAYEAAGPSIPLAGGAAGGPDKRHLLRGEATADSVVAVAIAADCQVSMGNTQSCRLRGEPSIVTRSDGQRIEEIDGRPAEEVYLEQLGLTGVALDDDEFEKLSITHPLAQPELHGDVRLRHVTGRTGDGAILSGSHIPPSAAIEFTELGFEDLLSSGERSVNEAAAGLAGAPPRAALVFNCAGRRRALRDGLREEVAAVTGALGSPPPPLAGLYTHGEVARLQGAKGDRNHAVVTVVFG